MVRVLIAISEKDLKELDRYAHKKKQSRAAIMREALDLYLKIKGKKQSWEEIVHKTAGMWKHKKIDGLKYTNKLREEWEVEKISEKDVLDDFKAFKKRRR